MESILPEIPLLPVNAAGTYGDQIDGLLHLVAYIVTPWTVLTYGLIILFCVIYHRSQEKQGLYVNSHDTLFHLGSLPIPKTAVIEIPTLIVLALDLWIFFSSVAVWGDIKIKQPESDVQVQVLAKQFGWEFYYPGENDKLDLRIEREIKWNKDKTKSKRVVDLKEGDDEKELTMAIPAGEPIKLKITSKDVIHSLFIPNLRFKQDAVPGRNIDAWLKAEKITRPSYREDKILDHLSTVESNVKSLTGDAGGTNANTITERIEQIRTECDITGEVPGYGTIQSHIKNIDKRLTALTENANNKEAANTARTALEDASKLIDGILQDQKEFGSFYRRNNYTIGCAELCGTGHSGMTAQLKVMPRDVYETYLQDRIY